MSRAFRANHSLTSRHQAKEFSNQRRQNYNSTVLDEHT